MRYEASLHRANAQIIYSQLGGKEKIDKIWPIAGEKKKTERIVVDDEMREMIKKIHGVTI